MNAARSIVMGDKPPITAESERLDSATLEEMCLNVGTLATIYLKPVQTVFRSARPRKLQDSPALQKHNTFADGDHQKSISMFGYGGQPNDIDLRTRTSAAAANGDGDLAQAVNDADAYFSSVGSQQMAAMRIDQADDIFGENNTSTGYVVSAQAPQAVMQPAQGAGSNGDLLVL
jgi:AP-2 complex subunit beta-1